MQYVLDMLQWRHMSFEASQLTGNFVQQLVQYNKKKHQRSSAILNNGV